MEVFSQSTPSDVSSETLLASSQFSSTPSEPQTENVVDHDPQEKKRGRKGHTKSRTGCFNCKRARIKVGLPYTISRCLTYIGQCKENRPSCDYCAHRGLKCEWPIIQINQIGALIRGPSPDASIPPRPQTQLPVFTLQDFRLFNFFIQSAHPHHPMGNTSVWKHEIPCLASDVRSFLFITDDSLM